MLAPRAIVTRPAREAAEWVTALQDQGIAAVALPLIAITPHASPELYAARERLADYRAAMFVSGNAVQHFFEPNRPPALMGKALAAIKTRVWTPGPGTARQALALGVPAALIDGPVPDAAQFDSEALWAQVAAQVRPGDRVLIVRGLGSGREWLAEQIRAAGGTVDFVAAYQRSAPKFTAEQFALAQAAAHDGSLWLFSSSEAIAHLPGADWSQARAIATHPRIAQAARTAGFGGVSTCKPALADVVSALKLRV